MLPLLADWGTVLGKFITQYLRSAAFGAIVVLALSSQSYGATKSAGRSPAQAKPASPVSKVTTQNVDKVLDVKGQSRAWNRLSGVHRGREAIDFVQTRTDYRAEIENTRF